MDTKLNSKRMEMVRMNCGFENGIDIGAVGSLGDCNLNDLDYVGRWYTWKRGNFYDTNIRERLDRGVATLSWINNFPIYQVEQLSHSFSDHCPILLDTMKKSRNGLELENGNGRRTSSTEELLNLASDYFKNLFSASEVGSDEHVFGLVEKRVTESMNDTFLKQFTKEDIGAAVKMMAPLKAPSVDGFPIIFFQRYWNLIGPDISSYYLSILNGEAEIADINKTRIVLIPKVEKPKNLSQFKPISLCNVIYKIIAKVLVNRMSSVLEDCIDEAQWAFIPGRLISDNMLIAYQLLHSLKIKKSGKKGNFALKLDMSKAMIVWNGIFWQE
ncbi:hypothetical protein PVK06_029755 [Gossypium arboreum]|uniref:Reverse transcriptase domain-containing protein n=1 Tax=Gossypium arboreum TaxID=29729 RepID=A0ABR0NLE4_GOSAR|nr:hypothetical protein PVK06_029755 [Gossypium arboreum]